MEYLRRIFSSKEPVEKEKEIVMGRDRSNNYNDPEKIVLITAHGCIDVFKKFDISEDTSVHYLSRPGFVSCVRIKENRTFKCVIENIERNFQQTYNDFHNNLIQTYQKIFPYNSGLNDNKEIHDMKFHFHDQGDTAIWKMTLLEFTKRNSEIDIPDLVPTKEFSNETIEDRMKRVITNLPQESVLLEKLEKEITMSMKTTRVPMTITLQDIINYYGRGVYIINTCSVMCDSSYLDEKTTKDAWNYLITYYERNTVESRTDGYTYKMCDKYVPITKIDTQLLIDVEPEFRTVYIQNEMMKGLMENINEYFLERTINKKQMITNILCSFFDVYSSLVAPEKIYGSCEKVYDEYMKYYKKQPSAYDEFYTWLSQNELYPELVLLFHKRLSREQLRELLLRNQIQQYLVERKSTNLETKFSIFTKKELKRKRQAYEEVSPIKKRLIV